MNENIQKLLQARINAFATDITEILTSAVADAVAQSFGTTGKGRGRAKAGRAGKRAASSARGASKVAGEDLLRAVAKGGAAGLRMEQIGKAMKTPTKHLIRPMKALLEEKKVKRSGQARGTTYRVA